MTRLILASLALAVSTLPLSPKAAPCTRIDLVIRQALTGRGKYVSTYNDGYGGTTGTIGNKRISTYEDGYGNTTGTIGRDRINVYTDRSGITTGTIGRRRLNYYTDRFRTTRCN